MSLAYWFRELLSAFRPENPGRREQVEIGGQLFVRRLEERRVLSGAPPVGVVDAYMVAEGGTIVADDANGSTANPNGVLVNDTDDEFDPLTATLVSGPANHVGVFTLNSDGTFTYTHDGSSSFTDTFIYKANDGTSDSLATTVTITITPVDDPPVITNVNKSVAEDGTLNFTAADFTSHYNDEEGSPLVNITIDSLPTNGTLLFDGDAVSVNDQILLTDLGDLSYEPDANYNGADSFLWSATPLSGPASNQASVNIAISEVNDPVASTGTAVGPLTVAEDSGTTSLGLSGVDYAAGPAGTDEDSQQLTYKVTALPAASLGAVVLSDGVTAVSTTPTYTLAEIRGMKFIPTANANGSGTFTFTVTDNGTTSGIPATSVLTQSVNITVTEVNDAPSGADDSKPTVEENTPSVTFSFASLLGNDSKGPANENGQTLTITSVSSTPPVGGTVQIVGTDVVFTPTADYNGAASFVYTLRDNGTTNGVNDFKTSTATVSFTISEVNASPVATDDTLADVFEDTPSITITPAELLDNDVAGPPDESGQTLTITAVDNAVGGTVAIVAGNVVFTPTANYHGPASFRYTIEDNGTTDGVVDFKADTATASFDIISVNDPPVGLDSQVTATEDTAYVFELDDFGFSDPNDTPANDVLEIEVGPRTGGGTLTYDGNNVTAPVVIPVADIIAGKLVFTPAPAANGPAYASFDFTVRDDGGTDDGGDDTADSPSTMTINVSEVNDTPTANAQSVTTSEDVAVTITLTGADGDNGSPGVNETQTLTYKISGLPTNGKLYQTADGVTLGAQITVAGTTVTDTLHRVIFVPDGGENASPYATFQFTTTDNGTTAGVLDAKTSAAATVTVGVTEVNDTPIANPQTVSTTEDADVTITLTGDDGDDATPDGNKNQSLTFTVTALPTNGRLFQTTDGVTRDAQITATGTVVTDSQGRVIFVPDAGENGSSYATFQFTATDNGTTAGVLDAKTSAAATVTLNVTEVNDTPAANAQSVTTAEDTAVTITLTGDDGDAGVPGVDESQTLTYKISSLPTNGKLYQTADGVTPGAQITVAGTTVTDTLHRVIFVPDAGENAAAYASFQFTVTDNGTTAGVLDAKTSAPATVSVGVTEVNDTPIANAQIVTTAEDTAVVINLTADDGDNGVPGVNENQTLVYTITSLPTNGKLYQTIDGVAPDVEITAAGTVVTNGDAQVIFVPDAGENFSPYATFQFEVSDDGSTSGVLDSKTSAAATVTVNVTEVNDMPTANSQSVTTAEDTQVTITLGGDDGDAGVPGVNETQALTYTISSLPTNGKLYQTVDGVTRGLEITAAGTAVTDLQGRVIFVPDPQENDNVYATFEFTATDNGTTAGLLDSKTSAPATVTIKVTEVNDTPIANAQTATTAEDTDVTITLAADDGDNGVPGVNENQTLVYTIISLPTNGKLYQTSDGITRGAEITAANTVVTDTQARVIFVPDANENSSPYATFQFNVSDNGTTNGVLDGKTSAAATVTVNVTEVNDTPTANSQNFTTVEDTQVTITLGGDDGDAGVPGVNEIQVLTYKISSLPTNGKLYQTIDGVTRGLEITTAGTVVTDLQGRVIFVPDPQENDNVYATFEFTATDNGTTAGLLDAKTSAPATVTIKVTEVNDTPIANAQTATTAEDTDVTITLTADDGDNGVPGVNENQTLVYTITSLPTNGKLYQTSDGITRGAEITAANTVVTDSQARVIFVPDANENLSPYATFQFNVSDNGTTNGVLDGKTSPAATVTVNVTEVNDTPTVNSQTVTTVEDTDITVTLSGDDGDAGVPGVNEVQALTYRISSLPTNGTLYQTSDGTTRGAQITVAGTIVTDLSNRVIFVPAPDDNGVAYSTFQFTATDNGTTAGAADPKTSLPGTVTVNVTEVNDPPNAIDDNRPAMPEDTPSIVIPISDLLSNDNRGPANESGQTITLISVGGAVGGSVAISGSNVVFTPTPDFNGPASFTYTIEDNGTTNGVTDRKTSTATVRFTITEVNDAPTGVNDPLTSVAEDSAPRTIPFADLLGNDSKGPLNESSQTLTIISVDSVFGGTAVISGTNVIFTPNLDFNGPAGFSYTLQDNGTTNGSADFKTSRANVTFTITEVNDPPVRTGAVAPNLTVDEDAGTVSMSLSGVSYAPGPATATDEASQTLRYVITQLPPASIGTITLASGAPITVGGIYTLSDIQGLMFITAADGNGLGDFSFDVEDNGTTNGVLAREKISVSIAINVQEINDVPTADNDLQFTNEDVVLNINVADVLDGDTTGPANESNQTLTVSSVNSTSAQGGTVELIGSTIRYTPPANFSGVDTITYTVTDNGTSRGLSNPQSTTGTVTVNLSAVADPPTFDVTTTSLSGNEGDTLPLVFHSTPADADGSESITSYVITGLPSEYVLSSNLGPIAPAPSGSYTLTPAQLAGLQVRAVDNTLNNGPITISITATSTEAAVDAAVKTASTTTTFALQVNNLPPAMDTGAASNIGVDQTTTVTITVSDPAGTGGIFDTVSVFLDFGDPLEAGLVEATRNSDGTYSATHTYQAAPNGADPSAPIQILVQLQDEDGGVTQQFVTAVIVGPGISTPSLQIANPSLPPLIVVRDNPTVRSDVPIVLTITNDTIATRGQQSETIVTGERVVELRVLSPTGEEVGKHEITDEALADLPAFFKNFPNGRYRIYILQGKGQKSRLVIDVEVRQGQPVTPGDDGEGTRDRSPGAQSDQQREEEFAIQGPTTDEIDRALERWAKGLDRRQEDSPLPRFDAPAGERTPTDDVPEPRDGARRDAAPDEAEAANLNGAILLAPMAVVALDRRRREQIDQAMSKLTARAVGRGSRAFRKWRKS